MWYGHPSQFRFINQANILHLRWLNKSCIISINCGKIDLRIPKLLFITTRRLCQHSDLILLIVIALTPNCAVDVFGFLVYNIKHVCL